MSPAALRAGEDPLGGHDPLGGEDPLAVLAAPDGPLRPGFDHVGGAPVDHGAWTAWTFGAFARALIARGRTAEAERLVDWLDALPLPADGPTGAVARFVGREVQRLRLALRAGPFGSAPQGGAA